MVLYMWPFGRRLSPESEIQQPTEAGVQIPIPPNKMPWKAWALSASNKTNPLKKVERDFDARFTLPHEQARDVMLTFIYITERQEPPDQKFAMSSTAFGHMLWTYFLHSKLYPLLEQAYIDKTPAGEQDWRHIASSMGIRIFPYLGFWRRGRYVTQEQTNKMLQYQSKQIAGGQFYLILQQFLASPGRFCAESIKQTSPERYRRLMRKRLSMEEMRIISMLEQSDARGGQVVYTYPTKMKNRAKFPEDFPPVDPKLVVSVAAAVANHQIPAEAGAAALIAKASNDEQVEQVIEELKDYAATDAGPAVNDLVNEVLIQRNSNSGANIGTRTLSRLTSSTGSDLPRIISNNNVDSTHSKSTTANSNLSRRSSSEQNANSASPYLLNRHVAGQNGNRLPQGGTMRRNSNALRGRNVMVDDNSVFHNASESELPEPIVSAVSDVTAGRLDLTAAAEQVLETPDNATRPSGSAVGAAAVQIQTAASSPPGSRRWKDAMNKLAAMATVEQLKGATAKLYESRRITGPVAATFLTAIAALGARKMTTRQKEEVQQLMTLADREQRKGPTVSRSTGLAALGIGALGGLGAYGGYWLTKSQRQKEVR